MAFIEIEFAGDHIARKEDILQTVVIEIADADAAAVVNVDDVERVEGIVFRDLVIESDPGCGGWDVLK